MLAVWVNHSIAGQGFLDLFVSLLLLTILCVILLVISRKWMLPTRSFLLLGMIASYVTLIALNLVFLTRPDHRPAILSVAVPDRVFSVVFPTLSKSNSIQTGHAADQAAVAPDSTALASQLSFGQTADVRQPLYWSGVITSMASVGGVIWLCGTVFLILRLGIHLACVCLFIRGLTPVADRRMQQLLQTIQAKLHLREVPRLYSSSRIESPLTVGLWHPVIVMPAKLLAVADRDECLSLLGHEAGHIKHLDNLTGLFQRIFIALNWFNPLAHVISARYSLTREDICDDYAIQMIDDATRYTTCLVTLAEKSCLISSLTPAVGLVGSRRSLAKRLKRLLGKEQTVMTELTRTRKWALTGSCVALILCCAGIQTVFAQDYDAVGKRLREAVSAGELTGEQARIMLGALRKASQSNQGRQGQRVNKEQAVKRIQAGTITREQAVERMVAYKKRVGQGKASADADEELNAVRRRMSVAIKAGQITREQAIERMAAYKKRVGQGKASADTEEKLDDAIAKRLKAAVKAGKISEEDARARLNRTRKMLDTREPRTREGDPKAIYANAKKEIKAAIKAGKITEAQGRERLAGLKRHLAGAADKPDAAGLARQRNLRAEYAAAEKRIMVAIKDGTITEAQGKERLGALKKRLFESPKKKETWGEQGAAELARKRSLRAKYAAAEKRVMVAIKDGTITEAQGKERLAALKEHLFGSSKKEQTQAEHGERREQRERSERKQRR